MKTALLSLVIAVSVAILSLLQFDRYQKFTQITNHTLAELDKKVHAKLAEFDKDVTTIKQQEQNLLSQVQNTDWKLKEAEYFVALADAKLHANRDVKAAIELLTEAAGKIQALSDPELVGLQQALSTDLNALKQVSVPNVEDMWFKVSQSITASQKISPRHSTLNAASKETSANIPAVKAEDTWQTKLHQSFDEIKSLVKIRRYSKPIEPLLSETQQSMVQDILRSLLEQIRFAILNSEDKQFQKSIQETHEWIASYYETNDLEVKNLQDTLKKLAEINLRPTLPALTSVEQFSALRQ